METAEYSAEVEGEIPNEEGQKEDYDPAWNDDEDDDNNEDEEIDNPDENDELNDELEDDEDPSNVQNNEADNKNQGAKGKRKRSRNFNTAKDEQIISRICDNAKVKLSDGTEAPIFSRGPRYFRGHWPINCHLCGIDAMASLRQLKAHLVKGRHERLLRGKPVDALQYKAGLNQTYSSRRHTFNNPIKIYPGESIIELTPDLYNRILPVEEKKFIPRPSENAVINLTKTETLQVYNKKAPVIGLSYGFYVDTSKSIGHYCSLCKAFLPGSSGFNHFIGNAHRTKYVEKHLPRLLRRIKGFLSDMPDGQAKNKIIYEVIRKVYRAIEERKGLRKVHIVQTPKYVIRCAKFCNKALHYADNHVMESDKELQDMVEKCRKGESLLEPDPPSAPEVNVEPEHSETHSKDDAEPSKHTGSKKEESSQKPGSKRAESSQKPGSKKGKSSQKPGSKKEESFDRKRAPHLEDNANNWDRYRRMLGAALDDIDEKYADYERRSEKHPAYEEEWKRFWNRRVLEIENDGLNPDDYDFKTEWIPYWKDILQKYHSAAISKAKFQAKKSLRLPFDKRSPSPIRKPRSQRRKRSSSPVRPARRRRTRSRSPAYRGRRRESPPAMAKPSEPPGVISVLRFLTALEDNLGSLGPKALEYLSKSLLYEKENGQNANQLMHNQDVYVFFVTAKEKLKGQLIANLVEKPKYKAVTNAIEEIDTLINMFDDYCKRSGTTVIAQQQNHPPQTSTHQEPRNNAADQYSGRSQDDYNRNRQQDFDKKRDNQYGQYQRGNDEMNQQNNRNSGAYDNQYRGTQNPSSNAASSANKYNDYGSNSNQYGQNGNMNLYSSQGSNPNQYSSRGNQGGGVWHSGTNVTFRNNSSNPQSVASNSGGGNNTNSGTQGNPQNQTATSNRDGNFSSLHGDRGGNYNSTQSNYSTNLGYRDGNNSSLGYSGNLNTLPGDAGHNQGNYKRASLNSQSANNQLNHSYNAVYSSANNGSFNQGRNMAPPQPLMNKPLGNYGSYNSSNMNTRGGFGGGNV